MFEIYTNIFFKILYKLEEIVGTSTNLYQVSVNLNFWIKLKIIYLESINS